DLGGDGLVVRLGLLARVGRVLAGLLAAVGEHGLVALVERAVHRLVAVTLGVLDLLLELLQALLAGPGGVVLPGFLVLLLVLLVLLVLLAFVGHTDILTHQRQTRIPIRAVTRKQPASAIRAA